MAESTNRYTRLIEAIFFKHYHDGDSLVDFERADIVTMAVELGIQLPKNLGDVIYSFRYRTGLPSSITGTASAGFEWAIRPAGKGRYRFALVQQNAITPSPLLVETKIPDATPGVIVKYALDDEQSLLAKIRYNRLIDIFTGLTCYALQSHLRTTVAGLGQVETDEIYIGVDKRGAHYVIPVQAKGASERLGIIQIEQDFAICAAKFPDLIWLPVAAQFIADDIIALFAFEQAENGVAVSAERHYRLTPPDELTAEELVSYRQRPW